MNIQTITCAGVLTLLTQPLIQPEPTFEPMPLCELQTFEMEAALYREIIDQQRKDIDELHSITGKYHRLVGLYRARVKATQELADGWYTEVTRLCAVIAGHACSADLNDDGKVDNLDYLNLLSQWTQPDGPVPSDPP